MKVFLKKLTGRLPMRQTQFYKVVHFDTGNILRFKAIDSSVRYAIKEKLESLKREPEIEERGMNLLLTNGKSYDKIDDALDNIEKILNTDHSDNLKKATNEGWEFFYFFPTHSSKGTLFLIIANLYYPPNESERNVLYNLAAVKSDGKSYFVWDMTT